MTRRIMYITDNLKIKVFPNLDYESWKKDDYVFRAFYEDMYIPITVRGPITVSVELGYDQFKRLVGDHPTRSYKPRPNDMTEMVCVDESFKNEIADEVMEFMKRHAKIASRITDHKELLINKESMFMFIALVTNKDVRDFYGVKMSISDFIINKLNDMVFIQYEGPSYSLCWAYSIYDDINFDVCLNKTCQKYGCKRKSLMRTFSPRNFWPGWTGKKPRNINEQVEEIEFMHQWGIPINDCDKHDQREA